MKFLACLSIVWCVACATKSACPPHDIVFRLQDGQFVTMPEGFIDDPKNCVTLEEHERRLEELRKDLEKMFKRAPDESSVSQDV